MQSICNILLNFTEMHRILIQRHAENCTGVWVISSNKTPVQFFLYQLAQAPKSFLRRGGPSKNKPKRPILCTYTEDPFPFLSN
jgi:hypothetical protein